MWRRRSIVTAMWTCVLSLSAALSPSWALKPGEHIEMEQHADRFGTAKVFFDNQSLKVVLKGASANGQPQDLVIVSKAPIWDIFIYNDRCKLKYICTVNAIADESQIDYGHLQPIILKPWQERQTVYMSQPAKLVVGTPMEPNVDKGEKFLPGSIGVDAPAVKIQRLEYTVLQENVPPGLCHVVQAFFNVPVDNRYPLSFVQVTTRGSDKLMTTNYVCKKAGGVVLPSLPKYKTADNLIQVKLGNQEDVIKDIGLQLLDGKSH